MPDVLPSTAALLLARTARAQREGRLPSLVAGVVRDGALVWSARRGDLLGDRGGEPLETQYRLGSITKTVTAVAVLRARDAGLLRLDDPLDLHLSGTPFGDRTVGQLLAHGAGLRAESPTGWWERTPGLSWPDLAARLTAADVPHGAGRRFHYSNLGYAALGELLARLRGVSWLDVVTAEVLSPLEMRRTTPRPVAPAARGFAVHPWADLVQAEPEHDAGAMAPAGQLWSTPADLARFAAFLVSDGGDVLATDTLEEMATPYDLDDTQDTATGYGLGLMVDLEGGRLHVGHGGSMPGFLADVTGIRDDGVAAVGLANGTSGWDGTLGTGLLTDLLTAEPAPGPAWRAAAAVDAAALELVGPWYWGPYAYALRLDGDGLLHLRGVLKRYRASAFRPVGDGTWLGLEGYHAGEVLRVVRSAEGTPVALDLGSFVFSRAPYEPAAPHPGGVADGGWGPVAAG